jgi:hypothetical protein
MFLSLDSFSQKEEFVTIIENPATSVKDQGIAGCWSYATCSFIESELLRMKKDAYDLSEDFFVYYEVDSIQNNRELERVLGSYLKTILKDDYPTENWMKHYCAVNPKNETITEAG